eukprot:5614185-Prymnesium_polylepis.1
MEGACPQLQVVQGSAKGLGCGMRGRTVRMSANSQVDAVLCALCDVVTGLLVRQVPHQLTIKICLKDTSCARPPHCQVPPAAEVVDVEAGICHRWHCIEEVIVPLVPC